MKRFSLDLLRAVKKKDVLWRWWCVYVRGWGWNLWCCLKNFCDLWFEVGASNEKSCLWWLGNVVSADCSRLNPRVWGDYLSSQLAWRFNSHPCLPCLSSRWVIPCVLYPLTIGLMMVLLTLFGVVSRWVWLYYLGCWCYSGKRVWNSRAKLCRNTPGKWNDNRVLLHELDFVCIII